MTKTKSAQPGQQAANPGEEHITLLPNTAVIGGPDVTLVVTGFDSTFNDNSNIIFNGSNTVTTLMDSSHVSTVVKPSTVTSAGPVDVWVWTDGTHDTAPANFTFTGQAGGSAPTPMTPDAVLAAQLRAWGISGEPTRWANDRYQPSITAIRAANTGFGTTETVDGVLHSSFPFNKITSADVCLSGAFREVTPTVKSTKDGRTLLSVVDESELPPECIAWFVDGQIVDPHGAEITVDELPPGEHVVEVQVAIAGMLFVAKTTVGKPVKEPS